MSFRDPTNVLIRPLSPSPQDSTPRWTLLEDPNCDANILHMPICELAFFGRPKRARCSAASRSELSTFPKSGWPQRRPALADQGFLAFLRPAETEHAALSELQLPTTENFAITWFDMAEDSAQTDDCWFLPMLKDRREGLLLCKDAADGKFRRLGIVAIVKEKLTSGYKFLPWLITGPEEEVHLV